MAFRGSNTFESFLIDLQSAVLTPYKNVTGASVGLGFYKEWVALIPQVMPEVKKLSQQYPSYSVWVTGHSLGGALATLCALDLQTELQINATVYTYGSPRVGNVAFAQYYDSLVPNTFRIVNGQDIIPHLPLKTMNFYHVATEVWENPSECKSHHNGLTPLTDPL